jgi:hypothetical protein
MAAWAWLWPLDLAINGYGLVPLGYWLFLAWHRLAIGCSWLGTAWAWLLAMAMAWQSPLGLGY